MATASEALQLAIRQHRANRLTEAKHLYTKILQQTPNHPEALYGLGVLAQQQGQYQTAEELLKTALRFQPGSVKAWFSLGNLRQTQGQFPEAVAAYQQALAIQPKAAAVYNNLGYTLQQQGKLEAAIACYRQALEIDPNCAEADLSLGNALFAQGKLEGEQQAHYAVLNNDLGVTRKQAGDLKTAISCFQQAIALQPEAAIAHYNLGVVLQEQGELEAAIACYQKVLELKPNDAGVYYQLARNHLNRIYKGKNKGKGTESRELNIAFVSQYCDSILPPFQNSVGACTYGIVRPLAECCNIIAYGIKHSDKVKSDYCEQGVRYRFLSPSRLDLWLFKQFQKYQQVVKRFNRGIAPPPSFSQWVFPLYGRAVAKDLALHHCDVVHFQHTSQYIPIVRALNPTAKIVLTLHSELFAQHNPTTFAQRLRHVDFVTCVSNYLTQKTRRDFPQIADRCETIYNGIEASEFAREKNYSEARQRKVKRIMYAGAVSPQKGVHTLLEALPIVVQTDPDVQLEVIGPRGTVPAAETFPLDDPTLLSSLKPFYSENYLSYLQKKLSPDIARKVSFLGMIPRSQLIDHFFKADIFVFPPVWDEGFGIPPVEAMAAGTPVVATRSGAVVETVRHGETGFLVEKNNAPALAEAILQLLENDALRESMGKAARKWAMGSFTWEQSADAVLQLYESLCRP